MNEPISETSTESVRDKLERYGPTITFLSGLFRGLSAIGLGLLLLFVPDKSTSMLANKMGFFWLFSGIALLKLNRDDPAMQTLGKTGANGIAAVGIIAGLLMITRRLTEQVAPESIIVTLLGVVIMLTGLIHLWSQFKVGNVLSSRHRILSGLLGIFELILGLMLVISPMDRSRFTYIIVTVWALIFGTLAIIDAVTEWLAERKASARVAPDGPSGAGAGNR